MSIAPLRAFIGTPSTSMLTSSSLMCSLMSRSWRSRRATARLDDAVAVLDEVLELVPEMA